MGLGELASGGLKTATESPAEQGGCTPSPNQTSPCEGEPAVPSALAGESPSWPCEAHGLGAKGLGDQQQNLKVSPRGSEPIALCPAQPAGHSCLLKKHLEPY